MSTPTPIPSRASTPASTPTLAQMPDTSTTPTPGSGMSKEALNLLIVSIVVYILNVSITLWAIATLVKCSSTHRGLYMSIFVFIGLGMFLSLIPGLGILLLLIVLILTIVGTFRCRAPQQSKQVVSQGSSPVVQVVSQTPSIKQVIV